MQKSIFLPRQERVGASLEKWEGWKKNNMALKKAQLVFLFQAVESN